MIQFSPAIIIGKLISLLTRTLNLGGGSAAPGLYALKFDSSLLTFFSSQIDTNIIITGTNGKTTTSSLLEHFLQKNGYKTIRNRTGSNLERGIASAMLSRTNLLGMLDQTDVGIWEVDEAAFNTVAPKLNPRIIVFLNAFRDQLDRYGEVNSVVAKWQTTVKNLNREILVIANGDDSNTSVLAGVISRTPQFFGIEGHKITGEKQFTKKPIVKLDYSATRIVSGGFSGSEFEFRFNGSKMDIRYPLPGTYQIYNFLAAAAVLHNLNVDISGINRSLENFSAPFGRAEKVKLHGKECILMLIKNPVGATQVIETLGSEFKTGDALVLALNDNFADGTDISWIWDAEFEKLKTKNTRLKTVCSGSRAYDMAVRLKYAGIGAELISVEPDIDKALSEAAKASQRLFVLPTYTALLHIQKSLAKSGSKKHYWKE